VVKEDHGFMDFGLFTSIIDQVKDHAYDVNLFHRGEPLMHPRLADMVAYARDKGLYTGSTPTSRCSTRRRAAP
jgi:MoaA/NifB/PqqE/SkfB family radical SAM enzyme